MFSKTLKIVIKRMVEVSYCARHKELLTSRGTNK